MIQPPSCRLYNPGDLLAIRPLNWDGIIHMNDDEENWSDPGAPSRGRSGPSSGNDNGGSEDLEDMSDGEKGTVIRKGTTDGKVNAKGKATVQGKGKWKGMGHGKGKGVVKQTPGEDDISRAVAVQLQKVIYELD